MLSISNMVATYYYYVRDTCESSDNTNSLRVGTMVLGTSDTQAVTKLALPLEWVPNTRRGVGLGT